MLTILSVSYPLAAVGPGVAGGAEQVLSMLDAGIAAAGHRSLVIAVEGSVVRGQLITVPRTRGRLNDDVQRTAWSRHRMAIATTLQGNEIDLVHFHGVDFHHYLPDSLVPMLATLHLPLAWYPDWVLNANRIGLRLNCVSRSQKASCTNGENFPVIENGVAMQFELAASRKRESALCIGRICPEKNFHTGIRAAQRAGVHCVLAGTIFGYETHLRYFSDYIKPLLGAGCRFVGPVEGAAKRKLLTDAKCVLIPSTVAETSSLVAMEALSCGTPVIAFPSGELVNIVEHGRTGFIVSDETAMARAIPDCDRIDPAVCRRSAVERFSGGRMIREYLALYEQIVQSQRGSTSSTVSRMPSASVS